jgi:hypothetical protein
MSLLTRTLPAALALTSFFGLALVALAQTSGAKRAHVSLTDLCVSEGAIAALPAHRLLVTVPNVHATMNEETPQDIEARFVYLGPTAEKETPPSGHHQFGFEMLAEDACNLVYVMWRLEPESTIAVWVKSNPDQHIHSECGRHGTSTVSPERTRPLPPVWAGEPLSHTLRAQIIGDMLLVFADGSLVWRGLLPAEVLRTHGPVGIHSDNAKLEFKLTVRPPAAGARIFPCTPGAVSN